ncbi:asparaginyl-tRNA synthetase isoform X2 [Anabrus simplex]|uniref:asparaginyl-tRNA synthetase isoform X2 n=1 Tax=Anabrus simplex TaxID=316456 RepID=UPI0035A2D659
MAVRMLGQSYGMKVLLGRRAYLQLRSYKRQRIVDLLASNQADAPATIKGWVKAVRKMKEYVFFDVNDGSCADKIQVLIPKSHRPQKLGPGAAVEVSGNLSKNTKGQLELKADNVSVVGPCDMSDGFPFVAKSCQPPEYVRKYLHLRSQTSAFCSLLRIRDAATRAIHDFFHSNGFIGIHTPILTSNDCEGAGEVFIVRPENEDFIKSLKKEGFSQDEAFFDTKTYLTVSGQLHLEAVVRGLNCVYTLGPTFRAENSRSRHHLSEFYMVEAEAAFMETIDDLLGLIEDLIRSITYKVISECEEDMLRITDKSNIEFLKALIDKPFCVLTYDEAFDIVAHSQKFSSLPEKEEGFGKEHELFLVAHKENRPVFIVDWPKDMKPFYVKQASDPTKVCAVDLLTPHVGELCGGSLREDNFLLLEQRLHQLGLDESLSWYLELRKFGSVPSAGFGMGFERHPTTYSQPRLETVNSLICNISQFYH